MLNDAFIVRFLMFLSRLVEQNVWFEKRRMHIGMKSKFLVSLLRRISPTVEHLDLKEWPKWVSIYYSLVIKSLI